VKREAQLNEADRKALHAWVQIKLEEASCGCGDDVAQEDHMPGDEVLYNKDGKIKKQMDEDELADKDHDGDGEIESGTDEYLGSRDKAIKAAKKIVTEAKIHSKSDVKKLLNTHFGSKVKITDYGLGYDGEVYFSFEAEKINGYVSETFLGKDKWEAEVSKNKTPNKEVNVSAKTLDELLKKLKTHKLNENVKIGEESDEVSEEDEVDLNENLAIDVEDLSTNGAVAVGDASIATPKHADVIRDTDPYTNTTQYRMLLQFATNEGTRIYPPVSLPGARSVADLRTLVEGLPEFNEAVDAALVHASMTAANQVDDA
jgi:hypothetical protein